MRHNGLCYITITVISRVLVHWSGVQASSQGLSSRASVKGRKEEKDNKCNPKNKLKNESVHIQYRPE